MKSSRFTRVAAAALALTAAAASSQAAVESFTSGSPFFKRTITHTSVLTTAATTFTDVPSTPNTLFLPPQSTALVSVDDSAEAACGDGGAGNPNWCELMVLIGGVEGSPQASTTCLGDTCAFASTDKGAASSASWRGQPLSRHRCVRNTSNATQRNAALAVSVSVSVSVQWQVVQFGAVATTFRLDDSRWSYRSRVIASSSRLLLRPISVR